MMPAADSTPLQPKWPKCPVLGGTNGTQFAGEMKLALQICRSNLEIQHGHFGRGVTEQLHNRKKLHAGTTHLAGIGVPHLKGNDAFRNARLGTDGVQVLRSWHTKASLVLERASRRPSGGKGSNERKKRRRWTS